MSITFQSNFSISSLLAETNNDVTERQKSCEINSSPKPQSTPNESTEKPPFTYSALITMAIQNSPEQSLPQSEICEWIAEQFPFYKHSKINWQNSIRHNLTINKAFIHIPRRADKPGRGNCWIINPTSGANVGPNTGRLRVNKSNMTTTETVLNSMRKRSASMAHLDATGPRPHFQPMPPHMGFVHRGIPNAVYFPSPEEQVYVQQQAMLQQQWNNYHYHLLQQSVPENLHMQHLQRYDAPFQ